MPEFDRHHESESRYSCDHCQETGIDIESREYCLHCELGKRRMNLDRLAEPLRHHPFTNAMWVAHHSVMKTERAIAAAEMALLKSKLIQADRELAEVRKDAQRYRWLRANHESHIPKSRNDVLWQSKRNDYSMKTLAALDAAIDAAMSTPNKGESK